MKNYVKIFYIAQTTIAVPLEERINIFLEEVHKKGSRIFGMKMNEKMIIYTLTDEKSKR